VARSWNPKWKVDVASIDQQHERLFDRFDAFVEAASGHERTAAATDALFFLSGYVDEHFGDEEQAMEGAGYPGLPVHRELHQGFVRELAGLSARFREGGPTPAFLMALGNLFESWLSLHITREDRAFGEFLREQGGGRA
jgi:hemerythrin